MERKVTIRSTDLTVTKVGLGTNAVGGQKYYPNITDEDGRRVLHAALEYGVDFWDTAFTYGPKRSEEIIGEVLEKTKKRNDVVIATKAAHQYIGKERVFNNHPKFLRQAVEEALKRLRTDYIDLFYIHYPDETTPKYEAIGELKKLKDEGKIRAIGVSNFSLAQLKEANRDGYVNVYQGEYNLLDRSLEKDIIPYTLKHNISFVPYFPFASGILAGKYDRHTTFPEGDLRLKKPQFQGESFFETLEKVEKLKRIAKEKGVDVAPLVLAVYLHHDAIDVVIPGAKRPEQVKQNLFAADIMLSKEEIDAIYQTFA